MIWSIFTALTGAVTTEISLLVVSFLLGVGEAGVYPGASPNFEGRYFVGFGSCLGRRHFIENNALVVSGNFVDPAFDRRLHPRREEDFSGKSRTDGGGSGTLQLTGGRNHAGVSFDHRLATAHAVRQRL